MRTTISLDDQLLHDAERLAAETGQTLTALIEAALRERLARRTPHPERQPIRLATATGRGPLPGIDLDDSASLLDLMDAPYAPS